MSIRSLTAKPSSVSDRQLCSSPDGIRVTTCSGKAWPENKPTLRFIGTLLPPYSHSYLPHCTVINILSHIYVRFPGWKSMHADLFLSLPFVSDRPCGWWNSRTLCKPVNASTSCGLHLIKRRGERDNVAAAFRSLGFV